MANVNGQPWPVGQIAGTATNDSATAGNVGEYVVASLGTSTSATNTFTNASPTVVTWTGHPYSINASGVVAVGVYNVTNSGGAVPTGLSAGTNYYFLPIDANTGHLATSVANALAGTFVNTSSTGTGTQTGHAEAILSSSNTFDLVALNLTAGDWDVTLDVRPDLGSITNVVSLVGSISTTSGSLNTNTGNIGVVSYGTGGLVFGAGVFPTSKVGPSRISISSTTPVFGQILSAFSVSTASGFGFMRARRVR